MKAKNIITIPNILSLVRLGLIPVIVVSYLKENPIRSAVFLAISGVTDIVDGYIARHFNMTSDLGKALDPVADKLTQLAVLFCLVMRFPMMILPFALLLVKEVASGVLSLIVIKKTKEVKGADWHGKLTTVLLYAMMTLHLLWYSIPSAASTLSISICVIMMSISFILYSIRNIKALGDRQCQKD